MVYLIKDSAFDQFILVFCGFVWNHILENAVLINPILLNGEVKLKMGYPSFL